LLQKLLDCVESNAVVGNFDLVAALAPAVLAADRRPHLPVRTGRGLDQHTLEFGEIRVTYAVVGDFDL
jgi:hypothetical protein